MNINIDIDLEDPEVMKALTQKRLDAFMLTNKARAEAHCEMEAAIKKYKNAIKKHAEAHENLKNCAILCGYNTEYFVAVGDNESQMAYWADLNKERMEVAMGIKKAK